MFRVEQMGAGLSARVILRDETAGSSAAILPNFGFNCASFRATVGGRPFEFLWTGPNFPQPEDRGSHHGTPILAPFPNRIRAGSFRYQDQEYTLPCNEHGKNAIHGFVIDQPWRLNALEVSTEGGAIVRGEFCLSVDRPEWYSLWPADFRLTITYALIGSKLISLFEIENPDTLPLPFGLGTHPYFRFPLEPGGSLEDCEITVPAAKVVELEDYLPNGTVRDVDPPSDLRGGMKLSQRLFDDVFCGLEVGPDGMVEHRLLDRSAKVEFLLRHDDQFPYAVIYTPGHREAVCIEPYTCVTDAINLDARGIDSGLWHLPPSERRTMKIEYEARPLA